MSRPPLVSSIAIAWLLSGCGATSTPGACVPGESRPCTCADSTRGAQVCDVTGSALLACRCLPPPDASPDAAADGPDAPGVDAGVSDTPTDVPSADVLAIDVPVDVPADAPRDVPVDAPADVAIDIGTDAPMDARPDAPLDVPTDVQRADVAADASRVDVSQPVGVPTPTDISCPPGRTHCGRCVDVQVDPTHCGGCGRACMPEQVCTGGSCGLGCIAPLSICSGRCVDPAIDTDHCGACGNACLSGYTCRAGRCSVICPTNLTRCAASTGVTCVDLSVSFTDCGACGVRCSAGNFCNAGTCARSPGGLDASYTYPGLFPNPAGGSYFPSFMAHLMGTTVRLSLSSNAVCVAIRNPSSVIVNQRYDVAMPGYSDAVTQNRFIRPGFIFSNCLSPVFDVVLLGTVTTPAPASLQITIESVGRYVRDVTLLPRNTFTWQPPRPNVPREDMDSLSAVWITPHDNFVEARLRDVEQRSVFPGGFGARPYERNPYVHLAAVGATGYAYENIYLERGEELAALPSRVTRAGGAEGAVDFTLLTPAQYDAWRSDRSRTATQSWRALTPESAPVSFTATEAGWYVLTLTAPSGAGALQVQWTRSLTHEDIAEDALRTIYEHLTTQLAGATVAPVTPSMFQGLTTIRRPRSVLAERAATAADLAFTAASYVELIGMEPIVYFTNSNVWVGVRAHPAAPMQPAPPIWSMNLAQLGRVPFGVAFDDGLRAARTEPVRVSYCNPMDVRAAREAGVFPQP